MQATVNINHAQNTTTQISATTNAIIRRESTQKIIMFIAILVSLVGAVNL